MNPIAILAFITGIGTNAPDPKPQHDTFAQASLSTGQAGVQAEKPWKPAKHQGTTKRGGWDGN